LIRPSARLAGAAALVALILPFSKAIAQEQVPPAPAQQPSAPAPSAAPVFPPPDPANFTASSPTKEVINAFLHASWGYDDDRIWQVQAIMKTQLEGYTKVVVFVGEKSGKQKPSALPFMVLPDGKHIIAGDDIMPFGEHPFADYRAEAQRSADGPYRGSAAKDLELVEFADFQCPHCKDAQANMDKLAVDFPKARIVFQNYPLTRIHPASEKAAAVFDGQDGLTNSDSVTLTLNSAVTKAGLDPTKVAACASTPAIAEQVKASVKLAQDLNINQTPTLVINGRQLPIGGLPYETIKKIVQFQAAQDGIAPNHRASPLNGCAEVGGSSFVRRTGRLLYGAGLPRSTRIMGEWPAAWAPRITRGVMMMSSVA
jgi:protein-disulfide isomerase